MYLSAKSFNKKTYTPPKSFAEKIDAQAHYNELRFQNQSRIVTHTPPDD